MSDESRLTPEQFEQARAVAERAAERLASIESDDDRSAVVTTALSLIKRSSGMATVVFGVEASLEIGGTGAVMALARRRPS